MAIIKVSLPDQMKEWVERQSVDGRYANASDYLRDLIRADQKRQAAFSTLQSAITEGVESGPAEEFDPEFRRSLR